MTAIITKRIHIFRNQIAGSPAISFISAGSVSVSVSWAHFFFHRRLLITFVWFHCNQLRLAHVSCSLFRRLQIRFQNADASGTAFHSIPFGRCDRVRERQRERIVNLYEMTSIWCDCIWNTIEWRKKKCSVLWTKVDRISSVIFFQCVHNILHTSSSSFSQSSVSFFPTFKSNRYGQTHSFTYIHLLSPSHSRSQSL